ncbi:hypothetical protein BJY21_003845 [Kineosphaera limosa]|uniref:DUF3618 domain-containing protein n=1 Tax=Kineosphaera limosa NBRC 100340 TaxID=1184609 RepID=K6WV78_9MICO|nr:DUF3618 domain-containing protein [Kineosphaera limosa]NYE02661.1 hypothetical protein [Kineosphaera limosa]GAB97751.1 hypothetical protein KILIM_080_00220 [Kineosphaera limosa NBRC 100340]
MAPQDNASAAQIEKNIEQARARLTATVDELAYRVTPANVAKRTMAQAKSAFDSATRTPEGEVRYEVVAPVALAVVGLAALAIYRRVS